MKSTGIIRKVDELGRVVIPSELRRNLDIHEKDYMEIFVEDNRIVLKKYQPSLTCFLTGETSEENLSLADGKVVLSKAGAQQLLEEIQSYLSVK
ncbi:AbrB/MazE/SpoVT family DNA-binding domain-containing protein [Virgibacillus xinjiangensis]|uniref:AbrB/MazE/SpoVT family DNA-binding domain-containing protein n=1 Tax=Virgibacillus xinjiangensis TaxID=393090 RepID=A0ABV7CXA2_9BACI